MLKLNNISVYYGKLRVLYDVSLHINEKEIVALIGANAAGKTTVLNTICGIIHPASGTIEFKNQRIDNLPPHKIVEMGITQVREGGKVFLDMSVNENLEIGAYVKKLWHCRNETRNKVTTIFPLLRERSRQIARTLSGGERQMLSIGRSMMCKPTIYLFDEPSYGLSPILVNELFNIIQQLREKGCTILLVEQNVKHALQIADRAYVIENGRIVLEGFSNELIQNDHVRRAYLGI